MRNTLVGLLLLAPCLALGQYKAEQFDAALLEAKYGALLVFNGQNNSLTLKLESPSVTPLEKPGFVRVDNMIMQINLLPFQQKLDFENLDTETRKKYLLAWKEYEKEWAKDQLKSDLKDRTELVDLEGRSFLYWTYEMPKGDGNIDSQVYLVTIVFDQMLIMNGPVETGKKEKTLRERLVAIAKTLTLNPNKTLDIEKLYNELRK